MNYGLGKVIGDDETGFRGVIDRPYRIEAWDFLIAGGALYDNLDYSFTVDHEEDIRLIGSSRVMITDARRLRYQVPDIRVLDAHSRHLLERFL